MVREMPLSPGVIRVAETVQGKAFTMEPDIFIGAHSRFSLERTSSAIRWKDCSARAGSEASSGVRVLNQSR